MTTNLALIVAVPAVLRLAVWTGRPRCQECPVCALPWQRENCEAHPDAIKYRSNQSEAYLEHPTAAAVSAVLCADGGVASLKTRVRATCVPMSRALVNPHRRICPSIL
jgi:hypothetical protein